MKGQTLIDLALPYQRDFILSPAKRKIWLSSRQAGKSWAISFMANRAALSRKNGLSLCISTGARAANELMRKCVAMAEAAKALSRGALRYEASSDCVRFSNGSRILSLPSGNPAGLRGYTADATFIDECAFIERPWDVYAAITPTLTRNKDAVLVMASTPAGRSGLFWDVWNKGGGDWYRQTTTIKQAAAAGLDVDLEELRRLCPDPQVFDMEYMCRFADSWGAFVDESLLEWYDGPAPQGAAAYLGVDIGSRHDRTAAVTVLEKDGVLWVDDALVLDRAPYEEQLKAFAALHRARGYRAGYVDQNGIGAAVAEFASSKITPRIKGFTWTSANKSPAYEAVRAAVFEGRIKFSSRLKELFLADFRNVHRIVDEKGSVSFEAGRDENGHSDAASALVLAVRAARDSPASFQQPQAAPLFSAFGPRSSFF